MKPTAPDQYAATPATPGVAGMSATVQDWYGPHRNRRRRHHKSRTFHQPVLRGEHDQTGTLWIRLDDINKLRGKDLTIRELRRRSLLPGEDFQVVEPPDELARSFWPDTTQPRQILVSEQGMRRLIMRATSPADRDLRDWVTAQSLPALDVMLRARTAGESQPRDGTAWDALRNLLHGRMHPKAANHA